MVIVYCFIIHHFVIDFLSKNFKSEMNILWIETLLFVNILIIKETTWISILFWNPQIKNNYIFLPPLTTKLTWSTKFSKRVHSTPILAGVQVSRGAHLNPVIYIYISINYSWISNKTDPLKIQYMGKKHPWTLTESVCMINICYTNSFT